MLQPRDKNIASGIETLKALETSSISATNMVLSPIPIDGGHVVIRQTNGQSQLTSDCLQNQQHHLLNSNPSNVYTTTTTTQIHRNNPTSAIITTNSGTKNTFISASTNNAASNGNTLTSNIPTQSKYVFLQQNGNGQYTTNEVVLVSTEPMEMGTSEQVISVNEAGTATFCDEDLTPLTWLNKKNLLKEIVASAKNNSKSVEQRSHAQNNGASGGQNSPTGDYVEEFSAVSEEITSEHTINEYSSQQQQIHYSNNTNSQNLVKNRTNHQILSPTHNGASYIGSTQASINDQVNGNLATLGATTTVHVGPSGTTTVVEYKTNSNFVPSRLGGSTSSGGGSSGVSNVSACGTTITPANIYVPSSPQRNVVLTNVSSPQHQQQQQQQQQQYHNYSNNNSSSSLSTTHHPHKKYLQMMNGFDQSGGGGTNNSGGGNLNKIINIASPFSSGSSTSSTASSPASTSTNYGITTIGQTSHGVSTLSPEPTREYHAPNLHLHSVTKSPASYSTNSYENDSLKDFELTPVPAANGRISANVQQQQQQQHPPLPLQKSTPSPPKQKHPTNVPYDPLVHTHNKPPFSFSSLIFMAIEGSTEKALPVKEIYAWIVQHFPYFKTAPTGWKNSVRHNLSLNKSFVKVEKAPNMGKGSLWRVEQQQRQHLMQALTRSPGIPNSAVDKICLKSPTTNGNTIVTTNSCNNSPGSTESDASPPLTPGKSHLDATLFPNLSKAIKRMETNDQDDDSPSDFSSAKYASVYYTNETLTPMGSYESMERLARDCGADSIDDVNAATAMLALKHGPKVFNETFQNGSPVITSSPSEDHTYSAGGGGGGGGGGGAGGNGGNNVSNGNINNTLGSCNDIIVTNENGEKPATSLNGFSADNQSNCASSDAAYESSEESHNISPEELEDQQRHRDGVYALLSLSSHIDISPIKRPPSTTVEEEQTSSYMENIPQHFSGKSFLSNGTSSLSSSCTMNGGNGILDEGYNTQSYYSHMASPSPPKKQKPLRNLRAKIKRKATLIR